MRRSRTRIAGGLLALSAAIATAAVAALLGTIGAIERSLPPLPAPEQIATSPVVLDRSQGYAPLAGGKQRRRVQLLARLDELERLVIWYGR